MKSQQASLLAAYNCWMNQRLYTVCAEMADDERKLDRGAFFKSIHGTLNHLLVADSIWMARFEGGNFQFSGLDQELYSDFAELSRARESMDERIETWASELTDATLDGELSYTGIAYPGVRKYKLRVAVTHFFNHQTHHRGQVATLLSQAGKEPGVTDLVAMPGL